MKVSLEAELERKAAEVLIVLRHFSNYFTLKLTRVSFLELKILIGLTEGSNVHNFYFFYTNYLTITDPLMIHLWSYIKGTFF